MGFDIKEMMNQLNVKINEFIEKAKEYFESLTQYETYAWGGMGVGFIMVVVALIMW